MWLGSFYSLYARVKTSVLRARRAECVPWSIRDTNWTQKIIECRKASHVIAGRRTPLLNDIFEAAITAEPPPKRQAPPKEIGSWVSSAITGKFRSIRSKRRRVSTQRQQHLSSKLASKILTMPVSALRCCDWKNTASSCLQLGHVFLALGS